MTLLFSILLAYICLVIFASGNPWRTDHAQPTPYEVVMSMMLFILFVLMFNWLL